MYRRAERNASHQLGDVVSAHRDTIWLDACDRGIPHRIFVGFTHDTLSFHFLKNLDDRIRQFTKCIDYEGTGFAQRFHLSGVRAATAFDDRASVTETRAFARSLSTDVCDNRFGDFSVDD